jgi:hypothetical protein
MSLLSSMKREEFVLASTIFFRRLSTLTKMEQTHQSVREAENRRVRVAAGSFQGGPSVGREGKGKGEVMSDESFGPARGCDPAEC